jgi:hypothetical protein
MRMAIQTGESIMKLDFLCEYTATFVSPISLGPGPLGERIVADLTGGHFAGPRMRGTVRASGADWALVTPEGNLRLDVRAVFECDDGAAVYVTYREALSGGPATEYGDTYFISQIEFETGDPRYTWLNNLMAVGEGKLKPNEVSYRVYAVVPD